MDHRDDWPDGILEGDREPTDSLDPGARQSAERIARAIRNMNAVLNAMADEMGEGIPAVADGRSVEDGQVVQDGGQGGQGGQAVLDGQAVHSRWRASWRRWTLGPVAAAAAVAALVLFRGEAIDENGGPGSSAGAPYTPSMVSEIDAEADRPFVVFPTSDPDIAVVWLLNPKESD